MKLVNEKGKFLGIVNLVDILVILAILLVLGGIGYKVLSASIAETLSPTQEITVTTRVRGIYPRYVSQIEDAVGDQLLAGNALIKDAFLESVSFEPYVIQVQTDDGRIVDAKDPTRLECVFTIKAKVTRDTSVIKIGTQEIRVGTGHFMKTRTIEFSTNIESIELGE